MASAEFLIVLCSPRSAASPWVNREVAWFKTHRDASKILTVIIDGEPMASMTPGREAEECFPRTLLYKVGADLTPTDQIEDAPLAADARETGDGKRGAKLKLAAAMLGVGLDALIRRDDRRRAKRRRIVMAGMAASIAVLSGVTLFAVNQRNAAVAARIDADKQRDEAQSLVEFMLTDLRQRLDAVGRLDILDAVATRLLQSYEKEDLGALDPDALGRRARVLLLLGEVDNTRGKLDAALARYKEAAAATEELLRRNPESAQQIFDHAQSVFWVGYVAWQRGNAVEAKKYFTQYHDLAQQLVAIDPDKDEWRMEVKYALNNLGTLALDEGDGERAEFYFKEALAIALPLQQKKPADIQRLRALRESYSWLATTYQWIGSFDRSLDMLRMERGVVDALLRLDESDAAALESRFINSRMLAQIELSTGSTLEAIETLRNMERQHAALLSLDSANAFWLHQFGVLQIDIGNAERLSGATARAKKALALATEIADRLDRIDSTTVKWTLFNRNDASKLAARIAYEAGDYANASMLISNLKSEPGGERDTFAEALFFGDVASLRAAILLAAGEPAASRIAALESIQIFEPFEKKLDPASRWHLAAAYLYAGQFDQAAEQAADLYRLGFRHPDFISFLEKFPDLKEAAIRGAKVENAR